MRRRDILGALPAAALTAGTLPAAAQQQSVGAPIKITDIRLLRLRIIKDLGSVVGFMGPWDFNRALVGGGTVLEVHTNQGLVGIGPGIDPVQLPGLKAQLIGSGVITISTFVVAFVLMWVVKLLPYPWKLRVEPEGETGPGGLDVFEHGVEAYPSQA